jgi:hypothetical protein
MSMPRIPEEVYQIYKAEIFSFAKNKPFSMFHDGTVPPSTGWTRFNVIEYRCSFPNLDPYRMAAELTLDGIKVYFDDSSITLKANKEKERDVNNLAADLRANGYREDLRPFLPTDEQYKYLEALYSGCVVLNKNPDDVHLRDDMKLKFGSYADTLDKLHVPFAVQNAVAYAAEFKENWHKYNRSVIMEVCLKPIYKPQEIFNEREFWGDLQGEQRIKQVSDVVNENTMNSPSEYVDAIENAKADDYTLKDAQKLAVFFDKRMKEGAYDR